MSLALRSIAVSTLLALAGVANASNGYTPKPKPEAVDTKAVSSEQAKADVVMNKASGSAAAPESTGPKPRTRAEVLEELRQAQADGSFRRIRTNRGF